ncbi:hypothetical protein AWB68_03272 [Caballeronia choica]|uniref:Uncharacterized protein n=1 Tax=Caballeronia choica TaxID=326476 RepID=A0A158J1L7_9BURK|nr:hypothetical protein AWB68_03272 [Caballeronia choica]
MFEQSFQPTKCRCGQTRLTLKAFNETRPIILRGSLR